MECMNHLINPHNKASAVDSQAVGLVYDAVIKKTKLKMDKKPYTSSATGNLAHIWGASPEVAAKKFLFVVDITGGLNSFYLYAGLVEDRLVGDFMVPLLSCVLTSINNEIIMVTYEKPQYMLVNHKHVDTISTEIKMDHNKHISFCFWKVIVKLHLWPF